MEDSVNPPRFRAQRPLTSAGYDWKRSVAVELKLLSKQTFV
jgi:hypothetical protein